MTPLFVTFEGLDGSGKSTQLDLAARLLEAAGVPFVVTHEPGGTAFGRRIRELFLDRSAPADPIIEALLLFASRRQNLLQVIEPGLVAGRHVLCDRFTDSTLAYQGAGRGLAQTTLRSLAEIAIGDRTPDLTLWFDVDPQVAARRRGDDGDRLDRETLAFRQRVRDGYGELARREPRRIVRLDADRSLDEVASAVAAVLTERGVLR
jgi:dTMP kinase